MNSPLIVIIVSIAIVSYVLTCWAIIDVALKHFDSIAKKALWAVVAFTPFCGWLIYFLFGRKQGRRPAAVDS